MKIRGLEDWKNRRKMLKEFLEIINLAHSTNTQVYLVGGYLRDILLKNKSLDMDLVVSKNAGAFSKKLAAILKGTSFVLHEDMQIYRVAIFDNPDLKYVDVSLMQGKNIEEDLVERDFTVNALAVDINKFDDLKKNLIDVSNGIKDLKNKQLKAVSKNIFKHDSLRILRAFRIAGDYNFKISQDMLKLMKKSVPALASIAKERIKSEFFRILNGKNSAEYLAVLDDIGALDVMFPMVKDMKASAKSFYYHPKGLFQHCFQTYEALEKILIKIDKYFPQTKDILEKNLNESYSEYVTTGSLLKFAALFHDCAKPECAKRMDNKMRFLGHEDAGAKKTAQVMKELKMGRKEINFVKNIIEEHMRPSNLTKAPIVTVRAQHRLFRDLKEFTPYILMLAMADWHSYRNLKVKVYPAKVLKQQEKTVAEMIFNYFEFINKKPKVKIIDGNILMKEFKLKPGKIIGDLLSHINALYDDGKIKDRKQALFFAKSQLTALKKKYKIKG